MKISAIRALLCFVMLLTLLLAGQAWASKEVVLVVDGRERKVSSFGRDVSALLRQEMIDLAPEDRVYPALNSRLTDGLRVEVIKAKEVKLILGDEERTVLTVPRTVKEFLAAQKVALGPEDIVEPELNHVLQAGETVKVTRVSTRREVIEEKIPFNRTKRLVASLAAGQRRVLQRGQDGLRKRIIQITYINGKPAKKVELKSEILREPVTEIIAIGTARPLRLASRSAPERYRQVREMVATAYALHRTTSTGKRPGPGTVAVDPRVIPLGTRLFVEGYGYGRAEDVGSAIKGNRIDVYFDSMAEAERWGRREVRVYILD